MARKPKKPAATRARGRIPARVKWSAPTGARGTLLLVATRKGAWIYRAAAARKAWKPDGPHFLGHVISHLVLDPRDGKTLLAAAAR